MKRFSQQLARAVKNYRLEHGLTQEDFARRVNSNKPSISLLENGKSIPRREVLDRIWALIHPDTEVFSHPRPMHENISPYGQPYLQWLAQIIESEEPYITKVQIVRDSAVMELSRLQRNEKKNSA